ncbi:MAG: MoxR family ATPase, partial [Myxococcales bacterium]|nr:MoxR family ATPase [Myxococcales bacterium]
LPDAFLRRCIFHFIAFPEPELMARIVKVHHPLVRASLVDEAIARFYWLRSLPDLRKRPSTSELIDWIGALERGGLDLETITDRVPYLGTLLKKEQDLETLARQAQKKGRR